MRPPWTIPPGPLRPVPRETTTSHSSEDVSCKGLSTDLLSVPLLEPSSVDCRADDGRIKELSVDGVEGLRTRNDCIARRPVGMKSVEEKKVYACMVFGKGGLREAVDWGVT